MAKSNTTDPVANGGDFRPHWKASNARPYLLMLASAFVFAIMGAFSRGLADRCDWRVVALTRAGLAFVFSLSVALATSTPLVWVRPRSLWIRSLAGSASLILTFYALPRLPVSDTLTLTNIFPLWIALLSWPLLGQRPGRIVWASVIAGIVGVLLIQRPHFAEGNLATLAAIAASGTTAVAMLGLNRLKGIAPNAIVVHFSLIATIAATAAVLGGSDIATMHGGWTTIAMLVAVGATATTGQMLMTRAFTSAAASRVSVVALTQVVFAMLFDVLIWGKSFEALSLVGTALVLAPTAWLLARPRSKKTQQAIEMVEAV